MPRLVGYREYFNAHYYDCLSLSPNDYSYSFVSVNDADALQAGYVRLFGNRNIGDRQRTNMQVAGQLVGANPWLVRNWYGHTNIPPIPEFESWAAVTFAEFVIGIKPFWRLPLTRLLARPEDKSEPPNEEEQRALELHRELRASEVAAEIWSAHGARPKNAFDAVQGQERVPWLRAADRVLSRLERHDYLVVPTRQNFDITITTSPPAYKALLDALARHKVEPGPRVWLHLQGWTTRDVQ